MPKVKRLYGPGGEPVQVPAAAERKEGLSRLSGRAWEKMLNDAARIHRQIMCSEESTPDVRLRAVKMVYDLDKERKQGGAALSASDLTHAEVKTVVEALQAELARRGIVQSNQQSVVLPAAPSVKNGTPDADPASQAIDVTDE